MTPVLRPARTALSFLSACREGVAAGGGPEALCGAGTNLVILARGHPVPGPVRWAGHDCAVAGPVAVHPNRQGEKALAGC